MEPKPSTPSSARSCWRCSRRSSRLRLAQQQRPPPDFRFYTIYFERQSLEGLQVGADVIMRGIKVGRVEDYAITENINRVRVLIRIDRRTPVSSNTSQSSIASSSPASRRSTSRRPDPPGPPLTEVTGDESHPIIAEGTSNLDEIAGRLNRIAETAAETLERLNDVLKPENRAALEKSLANLRDLTGGLNQRMAELDRTLKSIQGAATGLDRAGNSVADFADATRQDLRPALQQADRTMKDLSAVAVTEKQVAQLSQSVGSTVNTSGDQVSAAVAELRSTGAALNRLIDRLQDPRAALLGPSPAQRGPGE